MPHPTVVSAFNLDAALDAYVRTAIPGEDHEVETWRAEEIRSLNEALQQAVKSDSRTLDVGGVPKMALFDQEFRARVLLPFARDKLGQAFFRLNLGSPSYFDMLQMKDVARDLLPAIDSIGFTSSERMKDIDGWLDLMSFPSTEDGRALRIVDENPQSREAEFRLPHNYVFTRRPDPIPQNHEDLAQRAMAAQAQPAPPAKRARESAAPLRSFVTVAQFEAVLILNPGCRFNSLWALALAGARGTLSNRMNLKLALDNTAVNADKNLPRLERNRPLSLSCTRKSVSSHEFQACIESNPYSYFSPEQACRAVGAVINERNKGRVLLAMSRLKPVQQQPLAFSDPESGAQVRAKRARTLGVTPLLSELPRNEFRDFLVRSPNSRFNVVHALQSLDGEDNAGNRESFEHVAQGLAPHDPRHPMVLARNRDLVPLDEFMALFASHPDLHTWGREVAFDAVGAVTNAGNCMRYEEAVLRRTAMPPA